MISYKSLIDFLILDAYPFADASSSTAISIICSRRDDHRDVDVDVLDDFNLINHADNKSRCDMSLLVHKLPSYIKINISINQLIQFWSSIQSSKYNDSLKKVKKTTNSNSNNDNNNGITCRGDGNLQTSTLSSQRRSISSDDLLLLANYYNNNIKRKSSSSQNHNDDDETVKLCQSQPCIYFKNNCLKSNQISEFNYKCNNSSSSFIVRNLIKKFENKTF
jgi:hypothetical protein